MICVNGNLSLDIPDIGENKDLFLKIGQIATCAIPQELVDEIYEHERKRRFYDKLCEFVDDWFGDAEERKEILAASERIHDFYYDIMMDRTYGCVDHPIVEAISMWKKEAVKCRIT